jgi:hypothetical protein
METFAPYPHKFVPTAVLPLHPGRIQDAVVELERVAGITRGESW